MMSDEADRAAERTTDDVGDGDDPFGTPAEWRPNATVSIGPTVLPRRVVLDIVVRRRREGGTWRRSAAIVLDASDPSELPVWNYQDDVVLDVGGESAFTGIIERSAHGDGQLLLLVQDHIQLLEVTRFRSLAFNGLTAQEAMHLILRLSGWPDEKLDGFKTVTALRPFYFAVPLERAIWSSPAGAPIAMPLGLDMFLSCHDETGVQPLKTHGAKGGGKAYVDVHPQWSDAVPRLCGMVMANGFPDARLAALGRAQAAHDFLTAALRVTQSKIGPTGAQTGVEWEAQWRRSRVTLSSSLFLHDVEFKKEARYVVFDSASVPGDSPVDFAFTAERFLALQRILEPIVREGRYAAAGKEAESPDDRKRLAGYQRALRWLAVGRTEELPGDALLAYWFALETVLGTATYPSVFDGPNEPIRTFLKQQLDEMQLPEGATINRAFLSDRLLRADPPFMGKLRHFCQSVGVTLDEPDQSLLTQLNRRRGETVHGAARDGVSGRDVQRLEHLLEGIIFAAAAAYAAAHPFELGWGAGIREPTP